MAQAHTVLLSLLFPRFSEHRDTRDEGTRLHRRRNFVRLLYLGNPPGAISRQDIEAIWLTQDIAEVASKLQDLQRSEKLVTFLDRLDDLLPDLTAEHDGVFWPAISSVLGRKLINALRIAGLRDSGASRLGGFDGTAAV